MAECWGAAGLMRALTRPLLLMLVLLLASFVTPEAVPMTGRIDPAAGHPQLHPSFGDSSALTDLIHRLPKAELHLHIEGTLEPELMFELAKRNGIRLPYPNVAAARAARSNYSCLEDFLEIYFASTAVLVTEHDFYSLAQQYLERAYSQNVKVAEIFFDPQGHMNRGISIETVIRGLSRAIQESPVEASLVMCIQRELSTQSAAAAMAGARAHFGAEGGIIALGLDGAELANPPAKYEMYFEEAKELGLHRTAHAGEEGGPSYVFDAIKLLGAERIDHGIRALEDPSLVAFMTGAGIPITLCPISNLRLQVYRGQLEEKIREMLSSGIKVTINSDDPAYFGSYVEGNYEWVARVAGLGPVDLAKLAANSFQASFMTQDRKAGHVAAVWRTLESWEKGRRQQQQAEEH